MRSPLRYVSARLFLLLTGSMLVVFGIHTYMDIKTTSSKLTNSVFEGAERASDLIVRSTRYSMLLNRKDDVHHIINTIGSQPGFVAINIYNKSGEIIVSTDSLKVGEKVDLNAEACNICHSAGAILESVPFKSRTRVYESADQGHILGLINPIRNEPACYNAACHAHSREQSVLGVLDVKMSLAAVDVQVADTRTSMIIAGLVIIVLIASVSGIFIYKVIRNPIRRLKHGMSTISTGNLEATIDIDSDDEIGELAQAFNSMAHDLKKARDELNDWAGTLEDRIAEKTGELQRVQGQVIHMEKMASLGKLSASVAHEINNPLFGILTYAKLGLRELASNGVGEEWKQVLTKYLKAIRAESGRCGDIVKSLLDFARQTGGEFKLHHLNPIIEQTVFLLDHHLEMHQISVETLLMQGNDELVCDGKQLQQAIMAPCINACEAMPDGGSITIRTSGNEDHVVVEITDTGPGIPEDVLPSIFEPFFTTKGDESGVGLGLAVTYGIVQRHNGTIEAGSEPNKGATFTITLPRDPGADVPGNGDTKGS